MTVDEQEKEVEEIFTIVERPPQFPGGSNNMNTFLSHYIYYPEEALSNQITGKVWVQFVILPDGTLTNIEAVKGIGFDCDEAAEKAVLQLPDWQPAYQRGEPVAFRMLVPLTFK